MGLVLGLACDCAAAIGAGVNMEVERYEGELAELREEVAAPASAEFNNG